MRSGSRGGNFLLDIGPTADGRIPVIMQQRLIQIGDWLKVNGEAMYGTRTQDARIRVEGKRPGQDYGEFRVKYDLMDQIGENPGTALMFTKKRCVVCDNWRLASAGSADKKRESAARKPGDDARPEETARF